MLRQHIVEPMVRDQGENGALVLNAILQDYIIGRDAIRGDEKKRGVASLVYFPHFALHIRQHQCTGSELISRICELTLATSGSDVRPTEVTIEVAISQISSHYTIIGEPE